MLCCPASLASGVLVSRPKFAAGCPAWTATAFLHPPARKSASGESVQNGRGGPALLRAATSGAMPSSVKSPVPKISARKVDRPAERAAASWTRDSASEAAR